MSWRTAQTHVSSLVFTDDRVYKTKRPVRLDFLDLSTPRARTRACRREVQLNRRLAPDVYEGLGRYVGPGGSAETVVVMKRMPEERRLSRLVAENDPRLPSLLAELAGTLAGFHRKAERSPVVDRHCRRPAVQRLWEESLASLRRYPAVADPRVIQGITELAAAYVAGRGQLFEDRIATGRAVDGHGDLLADDIFCLADGPRILDCLEFDDRLRHVDTVADMASLVSDLERLGRPDLAIGLLQQYAVASGDDWPASLTEHWVAYRALVRAKVAAIRFSESGWSADADEARRLLHSSVDHLEDGRMRLVLVGGPPGSGKSTLARATSRQTGWTLLSSDVIRREMFTNPRYTIAERSAVYRQMLAQAEGLLKRGTCVIMDATWAHDRWREQARSAARRSWAEVYEFGCRAPDALRRQRAERRMRTGRDPSAAGADVADALGQEYRSGPGLIPVDTTASKASALKTVLAAVSANGSGPGR